jgi:ABC-type tungstate transport system permease subunit
MRPIVVLLSLALILPISAAKARAADDLRLAAPQVLQDSGLLQYVVPRFSLKTGVRVEVVEEQAQADLVLTNQDAGTAVFQGPDATWSLMVVTESEDAARLADWLTGKIGKLTITV